MSVQRIASRYAKSLVDLAQERGELDAVVEDMKHFLEVCNVRDFRLLLKSPIVHTSSKQSVFKRLFSESYKTTTYAFLDIILRKNREVYLQEIANEFIAQYRKIRQISSVTLTTATALSETQLEEIKSKIAASGVTYKNVELNANVDPSIIGGIIIEFDDKMYDASVAHKIEEVRKAFS